MKKLRKSPSSHFEPSMYLLNLESDTHSGRFTGKLTIEGKKTGRPSHRLTFHQAGLKITEAEITHLGKNGETIHDTLRINHLKSFGEVRLHTENQLFPGNYVVKIKYTGVLSERLAAEPVFGGSVYNFKSPGELNLANSRPKEVLPCIEK